MRALLPSLAALCVAHSMPAQDAADLRARVAAALGGDVPPPARHPFAVPDACPCCRQALTAVALWDEKPGIDSSGSWVARVCPQDSLFFVTLRGVMRSADCGPFTLPPGGSSPVRVCLPFGAEPEGRSRPWPGPSQPGPRLDQEPDGLFAVRAGDRTLFREPADTKDREMGPTAQAFAPNGTAAAFARSQGPLVVASLSTGKLLARVPVRGANIVRAAVDDGATHAAFVVEGPTGSVLRLLTIAGGNVVDVTAAPDELPTQLLFVPAAGLLLGVTSRSDLLAWPIAGGPRKWCTRIGDAATNRFALVQVGLAPSPDGRLLIVQRAGGRECHVVDLASGTVVQHQTLGSWQPGDGANASTSAAWTADGTRIAWFTADGRLATAVVGDAKSLRWSFGSADLVSRGWARLCFDDEGLVVRTEDAAGARLRWPLARFLAPSE